MSIRTWVGRFSIVEGQVREEGPWLGAFQGRLPEGDSRDLYVLAEPAQPGGEEFCDQLVEVVGRLFQKENLSQTGALLRTLRAAHDNLRDWNRKSLPEHQVAVGAACLLLSDRTAYLAQAGPSLAYFYRDGHLEVITPQGEGAQAPLGLAEEFQPDITRFDLEPGDLLLVASTRLASVADEAAVAGALASGLDDALPEVFLLTRDLLNFSALLAACFVEADELAEEPGAVPEHLAVDPLAEGIADAERKNGDAAVPTPLVQPDSAADDEPLPPPTGRGGARQTRLFLSSNQSGASSVAVMDPPHAGPRRLGPTAGPALQPGSARIASTGAWEELSPEDGNGYDMLVPRVDLPLAGMERPVVRLRGASARPRQRYTRTTTTLPRIFPVPSLAILAALAVLVVGLVAWFAVPRSVQESREERFASLVTEARAELRGAPDAADVVERRGLITGAIASLEEAASIYPDDGQVHALRTQAQAALAELDAVVDLGEMSLVADLSAQLAGELSMEQLVVGDSRAFLLDASGGRVVELPLQEGSSANVVIQEGAFAGALEISSPLDVFWSQNEGETGRLLVLDDQRRLFSVTEDGVAPLVVRDAQEWGSLDGAATFDGSLYILDAASNQVWRYPPTNVGFDSERTGLLGEADLSGATALAIDDGLYVLFEPGGIRRFVSGVEQPFAMAGIDRGLLAPASLTGDGEGGLLVVDRGNKRLVSLSPDGRFQAQFVSRSFTDLRAAAVDPTTGLLYVLVGDSLYVTEMPRP